MKRNPNLQFLAEQGVLLLNAALTCEIGMPTVHLEMWKPFMDFFFKEIINNDRNNLHLVFWGEDSSKYSKLISRTDEGKLTFEGFILSNFFFRCHKPPKRLLLQDYVQWPAGRTQFQPS
mgnify:CR=1 FL=1